MTELLAQLQLAQRLRANVGVRDRWYHLRLYESVFVGSEAVTWLVDSGSARTRPEAAALAQRLFEAHFFHHVNDDHRFEDRELFYRFFIDEDKKFKAMWRGNPKGRWRFQPHTIANSSIVSLPIGEGVLLAWIRADHAAFVRYVHAMRSEARQRSLDTVGWRISKSRTTTDFSVFVQVDPSDTGVRKVKSSMELPLSVATRLDQLMACPARTAAEPACTCETVAPSTGRDTPSLLTLDNTGADSDSDEELLHERAARFISRSSVLSYLFKGVVERTENSNKYLDLELLPLLPDADCGFPRIIYRDIRPVTSLASSRDACTFQDAHTFTDGTAIMYELSTQHSLVPPSSSSVRAEVLGQAYVLEPLTLPASGDDVMTDAAPRCRLTLMSHVAYKGRLPTYAEEAILTKNSVGAMSRLRRALLPSLHDSETFEGIPSTDGDVFDAAADGSDALPRTGSRTDSEVEPAAPARPQHRITLQDFEILAVIGRGGYGKVFQVRRKGSSEIYAMKTLKKKDLITRRQASRTMVERTILSTIDHPFIVSLKYAFQSTRKLFMVMDFVGGGDFFSLLSREGSLPEERVRLYMAELISALNHLHKMGIVYRDLKPENVLLDSDGHVKLTDFGLSRFVVRRQGSSLELDADAPAADGSTAAAAAAAAAISHSFCGTEQYMAPEVLLQKGHSAAVDFWSLGILFSEMLTGKHPFRGANHHATLKNVVSPVVPPSTVGRVSPAAGMLMVGLLAKNPVDRLGSEDAGGVVALMAHPFFAGLDWDAVLAKAVKPLYVPRIAGGDDISNFDKVFTREDPVFSEVSTADEDAKPKSGGLFGLFKGKPAAASAAPVRQASFDNTPFRKFSYISPEFLDDED